MREILVKHLRGGEAFMPIDKMLEEIGFHDIGKRPRGLPYSFYELFYHIKFTQNDLLEYCTNPDYEAPKWPRDYWPVQKAPNDIVSWEQLKAAYFKDREHLERFILSEETDLLSRVPSGKDHPILREVLLVIEHTAYHSGQLLILLRHLGLHTS